MTTLLLVATVTAVFRSQSGTGSIEGTWTAQYQGRAFVRLELRVENGLVAGGLSVGNFQVDAHGAITSASQPPQHLTPVFDVTRQGASLHPGCKTGAPVVRGQGHTTRASRPLSMTCGWRRSRRGSFRTSPGQDEPW